MKGKTKRFGIGSIFIGGGSPVLLQSMTNTDTNDVESSVEQCIRVFDAGAAMVRLTVPTKKEIKSLEKIREELRKRNYSGPLVADVHFSPGVALEAAEVVEKIRINPGNYLEKEYSGPDRFDPEIYEVLTEKLHEKLFPLIEVCRRNGTAVRIGVNHGSLSERIKAWYGNTPEGMVESALDFIRIFHEESFEKLVISLKASSTAVMIRSNRLLVKRMRELRYDYPIHLGVTEAGNEDEGRSRSAVGIGSLLRDGIGDTIRVSLTEDPEFEIPVARQIVEHAGGRDADPEALFSDEMPFDPLQYRRRSTRKVNITGGDEDITVITGAEDSQWTGRELMQAGYGINPDYTLKIYPKASDILYTGNNPLPYSPVKGISFLSKYHLWLDKYRYKIGFIPEIEEADLVARKVADEIVAFTRVGSIQDYRRIENRIPRNVQIVLVLDLPAEDFTGRVRRFFRDYKGEWPVVLHTEYEGLELDDLMIRASVDFGSVLVDGLGDGIWIHSNHGRPETRDLRNLSFRLLQSAGVRISETEYIACPSCGRTLFNIQQTLKKVKAATREFTGLKIAVMGCIVNGPGEMADADYGYVGAGPGKVTLYKGSEAVKKNIPEEDAVEELLKVIREGKNGREI